MVLVLTIESAIIKFMAPAKKEYEQRLAAVEALRHSKPSAETTDALRKVLADRNNLLASKAAVIAGDQGLQDLTPDLLAAFDRFLKDAAKPTRNVGPRMPW